MAQATTKRNTSTAAKTTSASNTTDNKTENTVNPEPSQPVEKAEQQTPKIQTGQRVWPD